MMNYRDALDASKGCPKCCSHTLDRFLKNRSNSGSSQLPKPEKITEESFVENKKQPKCKN